MILERNISIPFMSIARRKTEAPLGMLVCWKMARVLSTRKLLTRADCEGGDVKHDCFSHLPLSRGEHGAANEMKSPHAPLKPWIAPKICVLELTYRGII